MMVKAINTSPHQGGEFRRIMSVLVAEKVFNFDVEMLLFLGFTPTSSNGKLLDTSEEIEAAIKETLEWAVRNDLLLRFSKKRLNQIIQKREVWDCYRRQANRHLFSKLGEMVPFCEAVDSAIAWLIADLRKKDRATEGFYNGLFQWLGKQPCLVFNPTAGTIDPQPPLHSFIPPAVFINLMETAVCLTPIFTERKTQKTYYQVIPGRCREISRALTDDYYLPRGDDLEKTLLADILYQGFYGVIMDKGAWQRRCKAYTYCQCLTWLHQRKEVRLEARSVQGNRHFVDSHLVNFPLPESNLRDHILEELVEIGILQRCRGNLYQVNCKKIEDVLKVLRNPSLIPNLLANKVGSGSLLESAELLETTDTIEKTVEPVEELSIKEDLEEEPEELEDDSLTPTDEETSDVKHEPLTSDQEQTMLKEMMRVMIQLHNGQPQRYFAVGILTQKMHFYGNWRSYLVDLAVEAGLLELVQSDFAEARARAKKLKQKKTLILEGSAIRLTSAGAKLAGVDNWVIPNIVKIREPYQPPKSDFRPAIFPEPKALALTPVYNIRRDDEPEETLEKENEMKLKKNFDVVGASLDVDRRLQVVLLLHLNGYSQIKKCPWPTLAELMRKAWPSVAQNYTGKSTTGLVKCIATMAEQFHEIARVGDPGNYWYWPTKEGLKALGLTADDQTQKPPPAEPDATKTDKGNGENRPETVPTQLWPNAGATALKIAELLLPYSESEQTAILELVRVLGRLSSKLDSELARNQTSTD